MFHVQIFRPFHDFGDFQMKDIHRMRLTAYAIVLTAVSAFERFVTYCMNQQTQMYQNFPLLYHLISLVLLLCLFVLSSYWVPWIVHRERLSKWWCGTKYVGGTWVEIVTKNEKIDHYSILRISYDVDKICLEGETYRFQCNLHNDGNSLVPYYSIKPVCSSMDEEGLAFTYVFERRDYDNGSMILDHGIIDFENTAGSNTSPNTYHGKYDEGDNKYSLTGYLIEIKMELEKLKKDRKNALQEILDRLTDENPSLTILPTRKAIKDSSLDNS